VFLVGFTLAAISIGWGWHLPHAVNTALRWIMGGGGVLVCLWMLFGAPGKQ
jgi:hypothetical protein